MQKTSMLNRKALLIHIDSCVGLEACARSFSVIKPGSSPVSAAASAHAPLRLLSSEP